MTVKDLLSITGGNANFVIQGTTEKDKIIQVAYGKVDEIKFPLVPYGKYDIEHVSVDENTLYIVLDSAINFAEINTEMTCITHNNFVGYLGIQERKGMLMTDKQFTRRLAKLNTALWDCIGEAETLCDEAKNRNIDENMKDLFAQYNNEGAVDCDIHNATLSEVSYLIKKMMT